MAKMLSYLHKFHISRNLILSTLKDKKFKYNIEVWESCTKFHKRNYLTAYLKIIKISNNNGLFHIDIIPKMEWSYGVLEIIKIFRMFNFVLNEKIEVHKVSEQTLLIKHVDKNLVLSLMMTII